MNILVAGGCGYLGSSLVPVLVRQGYNVTVVDLCWFGRNLCRMGVGVVPQERNLFSCTEDELKQYEQVIFLAGLSNDPMAEYDPKNNFIYNSALPSYLAYIAKRAGVKRFIYASSCSIYQSAYELMREDYHPHPHSPYSLSKLQGEIGVLYQYTEDFSTIALRMGTIGGYSPRMRLDLVVNTMFQSAVDKQFITVHNADTWRPILDIRDAVKAYLMAIQAPYNVSGIYNIISTNIQIGVLADLVKRHVEALTGSAISTATTYATNCRSYRASPRLATTCLGFRAQHDIYSIVAHLFKHKDKFNKDDDIFYNIKVLKKITI